MRVKKKGFGTWEWVCVTESPCFAVSFTELESKHNSFKENFLLHNRDKWLRLYWDTFKWTKCFFFFISTYKIFFFFFLSRDIHCWGSVGGMIDITVIEMQRELVFRFWDPRKVLYAHFRGNNYESQNFKLYILKGKRGFCKSKGKALKELSTKYIH